VDTEVSDQHIASIFRTEGFGSRKTLKC